MLTLSNQVIEHSTAHGIDIIEAIDAMLGQSERAEDRKLLAMLRRTMVDSEPSSPSS